VNRTVKLKFWILFVLVQIAGLMLPSFLCPFLLLPGTVAVSIVPNLPKWLLTGIIVAVNAFVWLGVSKFGGKAVNE